jgi:hypothetical protein
VFNNILPRMTVVHLEIRSAGQSPFIEVNMAWVVMVRGDGGGMT